MKIVFIGINPSKASPDCSAFHPSTKSRKTLDKWVEDVSKMVNIEIDVDFYNISTDKESSVPTIDADDIKSLPRRYTIVALGNKVTYYLTKNRIRHIAMPHPSGLNRKLNDPEYTAKKLRELADFILKYKTNGEGTY
jgi:hypothetical protein